MRIIKPYGRSDVEAETEGKGNKKRVLVLKTQRDKSENIADFAQEDPKLLMAQWVSAIDKIATKPNSLAVPRSVSGLVFKEIPDPLL